MEKQYNWILQNKNTGEIQEYEGSIAFANDPQFIILQTKGEKPTAENQKIIDEWRLAKEFENTKKEKLQKLEKSYDEAQWVDVKSKIEFRVQLRGDSFVLLRQKVTDARENGKASFTVQKNGLNYTIKDIPYAEWQKFYKTVQPISEGNYNIKAEYQNNIKNAKSTTELNKIKLNFPKIQTIVINI